MFRRSEIIASRIAARTVAAIFLAIYCAPLMAQVTSGTIYGRVQDTTGAVMSGVPVTIFNPTNGLTRSATTSESGDFIAPNLLPGTYTITVEAKGFKKLESQAWCSVPLTN